ncbi:MAG TPA: M28 family peptidase [Mycobacteriales bacterium]|nr:M28 family peptidase [Mycobacteriales bacterium]
MSLAEQPLADRPAPSAEAMMAWIATIVGEGIRRPGSDADQAVTSWAADQLTSMGLSVELEPLSVPVWDFRSASLTVWPAGEPARAQVFEGFALPHTRSGALEAPIVRWDGTAPIDGAIAVENIDFATIVQSELRALATSCHDPEGEFDHLAQTIPFGRREQRIAEPAMTAGADGFVGVLTGQPWDGCDYYVPYDASFRPVHGVWVSRADLSRLDAILAAGEAVARIEVDATASEGVTYNVVATLPGPGDEWVVIGSHHDAPWASAVEDASGVALVLAQAHYWSSVQSEDRPHNLMFLLTGAHMAGGAGTSAFLERHADLLSSVVAEVHLEHVAARVEPDGAGGMLTTDQPEVRWWFTSESPQLQQAVQEALERHDLRRSMVVPPEIFMEHPPTDGGRFHLHGVPLVDFLSAPPYLFDAADTIDKVHVASLEPVTDAVIDIVTSLGETSAKQLRDSVVAHPDAPQLPVLDRATR